MTKIRNTDGSYMSPDQIVRDLHTRITDEKTLEWLKGGMQPLDGESPMLAAYERGAFMRWLRNSYGMWEQNNPYVVINDPASDFHGVASCGGFPDNLSQTIVERFIKELNKPVPVTLTCRLDDEQIAALKAYVDDKAASLMPVREPPPTYVRVGVTDVSIFMRVEVLLNGETVRVIGADSRMGYVLTETWHASRRHGLTKAFGRKDGDVEIRWAQ